MRVEGEGDDAPDKAALQEEVAKLRVALADLEKVRAEWHEPRIRELEALIAELERVKHEWFVPQLSRLEAALANETRTTARLKQTIAHFRRSDLFDRELRNAAPDRKVAVLVRAHVLDDKVRDLLRTLAHGRFYDLFVAANETGGILDTGEYRKVSHSVRQLQEKGFPVSDISALINCSDQIFFVIYESIPDYDFYILVEDDVHLTRGNSSFIDDLVFKLRSEEWADLDLVATKCGPAWTEWRYYPETKRLFDDPFSIFFPFVGLSKRAVLHLNLRRHEENKHRRPDQDLIYCEGFVPSALMEAGEFRIADLLDLFPGCYSERSFNFGLEPQPLQLAAGEDEKVEILHPVYTDRKFLQRSYDIALGNGWLPKLLRQIEEDFTELPIGLRQEFIVGIREILALQQH